MFQLGLSLLRPVVPAARSAVRPTIVSVNIRPTVVSGRISTRSFSSLRKPSSILNELKNNPTNGWSLKQGARFFQSGGEDVRQGAAGISWQRMAATAGGVAAAVVILEGTLNRDTRAPLSDTERAYLNESFKYTAAGLAFTALAARQMFKSGFAFRVMSSNPWMVLGFSLVGSIATMAGAMYTPPERPIQKHLLWLGFNACQAAVLSPLFFFSPAILSRAALYTVGVVGSISYIGATATNDKYLHLGGPLLAGVTVVALSSLAPMVLPMGIRGLAISESISLYGGLAVFGGFVLYDTQKILQHARMSETGLFKLDALNESIGLELDMLNIFIRLVQILGGRNNRK
ncbi:hypothetical protein AGABI1DRAFT_31895 [Agaricus bisporus var. burnettii JB137-S8]|uniref:Uncharacterized protein n=2 Tax=Agaricus bisporus var. burnettii TaxID=192524 RepID=K5XKB9_AGABU|nr:uncharacterized protein AGABI1DRAFT_31895 [Agaricus bisporus var. burnettii JB137-S8]EKM83978.1 hypothetical protein AGABI1DRAFT_31895 [Agaricus bisporus var. burnettii JB137-S8]KAF7784219.1 hypothetical protein Agabi119p4_384 [Agaricus bisporus var. burnettii]